MRILKCYVKKDTILNLTEDSKVVHVGSQNNIPTIWLACPDVTDTVLRQFTIVGTGQTYSEDEYDYVGTSMCDPYVWHVLEKKN